MECRWLSVRERGRLPAIVVVCQNYLWFANNMSSCHPLTQDNSAYVLSTVALRNGDYSEWDTENLEGFMHDDQASFI